MSLRLLLPPCRLPARSERSWTWSWPSWLEELRYVHADRLGDRMEKYEAWAGSLASFETGKSPDAYASVVGEALLGELGRPAEIPQVLGNTPEYVLVPHGISRRSLAILFQATSCWLFVAFCPPSGFHLCWARMT